MRSKAQGQAAPLVTAGVAPGGLGLQSESPPSPATDLPRPQPSPPLVPLALVGPDGRNGVLTTIPSDPASAASALRRSSSGAARARRDCPPRIRTRRPPPRIPLQRSRSRRACSSRRAWARRSRRRCTRPKPRGTSPGRLRRRPSAGRGCRPGRARGRFRPRKAPTRAARATAATSTPSSRKTTPWEYRYLTSSGYAQEPAGRQAGGRHEDHQGHEGPPTASPGPGATKTQRSSAISAANSAAARTGRSVWLERRLTMTPGEPGDMRRDEDPGVNGRSARRRSGRVGTMDPVVGDAPEQPPGAEHGGRNRRSPKGSSSAPREGRAITSTAAAARKESPRGVGGHRGAEQHCGRDVTAAITPLEHEQAAEPTGDRHQRRNSDRRDQGLPATAEEQQQHRRRDVPRRSPTRRRASR